VLAVLDLPPEVMPLAAIFGPLLVVLVTLWTSPKLPPEAAPAPERDTSD
jgi:hypothetical protein